MINWIGIVFWTYWLICSIAMAIVISDGIFMVFAGLPPLFGVVSVWLANNIWLFVSMWVVLTLAKVLRILEV